MAELGIDRKDIYVRKSWRKNVMNRNSNPIIKLTIDL